jgi:hypothetical protein
MNTEEQAIFTMAKAIFHDKYRGIYASWKGSTINPDGSVTLGDKWGKSLKVITPEELSEYEAQQAARQED